MPTSAEKYEEFNNIGAAASLNQQKHQSRSENVKEKIKKHGHGVQAGAGAGKKIIQAGRRLKKKGEALTKKSDSGEPKLKSLATKPAQKALARVLQIAWLNVITTFGLSLIWINIHAVLSFTMPSVFCKLGEEWLVRVPGLKETGGTKLMKKAVTGAKIGEWGLLLFLDAIALIAIVLLIAVVYVMTLSIIEIIQMSVKAII